MTTVKGETRMKLIHEICAVRFGEFDLDEPQFCLLKLSRSQTKEEA